MAPFPGFEAFLKKELEELSEKNLFRSVKPLERTSSVHALYNRQPIVLFCTNDYLGLSFHPDVIGALQKGARETGAGAGAARLISGTSSDHRRLEEKLAAMKQKERALLYTAGYLANLGVLTALANQEDLIVMDKLCHASLVDGARLSGATLRVFPHFHYDRCEEILKKASGFRRKWIVTESVFSMDGDLADLNRLEKLKEKEGALLIVDDAHGTGVIGSGFGVRSKADVVIGTLSKAVGTLGGFAAGSETIIEYLLNFSRPFIFATALPPASAKAALTALDIIEKEKKLLARLWQHVDFLREAFVSVGLLEESSARTPIFPLILGDEETALKASERLLAKGFLIPAIRPPTVPKGKARLRLTVSAAHSDLEVERVAEAVIGLLKG